MKRVLVTGSAGFIGSWIVEEFVGQGWHVTALVHRRTEADWQRHVATGRVSVLCSDVTDAARLRDDLSAASSANGTGWDVLVHAAGRASDVGRRCEFRKTNLEAVRHITELVRELRIGRLVFISTTDVYGLRDFGGESEDELPLEMTVRNPYPEFKILAERHIRANLLPEQYAILRPAAVWGANDTTITARIVDFLRWSPFIVHFGPRRGSNRWPLAHVRNVATAAFLAGTRAEAAGQAINVVDPEWTSIDEFYRLLAGIYFPEKRFRMLCLPQWIGTSIGTAVSAISNLLNVYHAPLDPTHYAAHSVSRNLDFGVERMKQLFEAAGRKVFTRTEGLAELKENADCRLPTDK